MTEFRSQRSAALGTSLAVQGLGPHAPTAGVMGSVPSWRTKILQRPSEAGGAQICPLG